MDVVALLKKYKQPVEAFQVDADASLTEGKYPTIFKEVKLTFKIKGQVEAAKALEAVMLSQTKYCAVSAMVSKAVSITYVVEVNGNNVGEGQADFKI
jgi:putative redox protein